MTSPFSQPASGEWLKPKDIPGHLLLITKVHEIGTRYDQLSARDKPYAVFDYVDLDEPGQAERFSTSDNHPGIANKLVQAHRSGGMVLGRITQAPSSQGQPAWVLGPYIEGQDDHRASAWLAGHPRQPARQPATPPAPQPQPAMQAAPMAAAAPAYQAPAQVPAAPPAAPQAPAQPAPAPVPAAANPLAALGGQMTPEIAALLAQLQQQQQST